MIMLLLFYENLLQCQQSNPFFLLFFQHGQNCLFEDVGVFPLSCTIEQHLSNTFKVYAIILVVIVVVQAVFEDYVLFGRGRKHAEL